MMLITRLTLLAIILGVLGGCQKPTSQAADSSLPNSISSETAMAADEPAINIVDAGGTASDWITCPEQRPEMCTQIYLPVCGTVDTGVRCVTAPCPSEATKTFGNACTACADSRTLGYISGECEIETADDEKS